MSSKSSSSSLCSHHVDVLALFREVLFRARALSEKKRISIDYRRLCGLLPENKKKKKKKKDDVIHDASPKGARLSNKNSLSSRKRTTTRADDNCSLF